MYKNLPKILAVLVNYGEEQLNYLEEVVQNLKNFKKYDVTVIVNSNISINIDGVDKVIIHELEDYQLLPLTCRQTIWENKDAFDVFIYGENDHLFKENHIDNHIFYTSILPDNRITGLIQFEEDETGKYYPGYHLDFEWDFNSVEVFKGNKFAYFSNVHQATFILTKSQLQRIGDKIDFTSLVSAELNSLQKLYRKVRKKIGLKNKRTNIYSQKCKVNTDVFEFGGMKKLICISDFEENLIHHLPNLYIEGLKGRSKLRADSKRMMESVQKLIASK